MEGSRLVFRRDEQSRVRDEVDKIREIFSRMMVRQVRLTGKLEVMRERCEGLERLVEAKKVVNVNDGQKII